MSDSVYALKPQFSNKEGYHAWRNTWKLVYQHIGNDIRRRKLALKTAQREGLNTAKAQRDLVRQRADARKLMTLLDEAKLLRDRLLGMVKQMEEQRKLYPMTVEARVVDFHFNKASIQFPDILPRWVVKFSGKTMYIDHLDAKMGFSTRELDAGATLGMLRFRNVAMTIDENGVATIRERVKALAAA